MFFEGQQVACEIQPLGIRRQSPGIVLPQIGMHAFEKRAVAWQLAAKNDGVMHKQGQQAEHRQTVTACIKQQILTMSGSLGHAQT